MQENESKEDCHKFSALAEMRKVKKKALFSFAASVPISAVRVCDYSKLLS